MNDQTTTAGSSIDGGASALTGGLERLSFAALCELLPADVNWGDTLTPDILREVVLAAESREREACAKLCDGRARAMDEDPPDGQEREWQWMRDEAKACAEFIRMRSNVMCAAQSRRKTFRPKAA